MRAYAFACLLLGLMSGPASTAAQEPNQTGGERPVVVYGKWANKVDCNSSNATQVVFDALLASPEDFHDVCISTVGYFDGYVAAPERRSLEYALHDDRANGRRAGLYGADDVMSEVWHSDTTRARMVGKFWDCRDLSGPNVMMVMGYCHYTGGPFIGLSEFHPIR